MILCAPVNADTALELESLADGIPVIFYNSCPDASYLGPENICMWVPMKM